MASIRGILKIQSLNELTSENSGCPTEAIMGVKTKMVKVASCVLARFS